MCIAVMGSSCFCFFEGKGVVSDDGWMVTCLLFLERVRGRGCFCRMLVVAGVRGPAEAVEWIGRSEVTV